MIFIADLVACSTYFGHTTLSSTPYRQLENQTPNTRGSNHLYNTLEPLMMGIMVPETCWASKKICNKNHLLHLVGILFPLKLKLLSILNYFLLLYFIFFPFFCSIWIFDCKKNMNYFNRMNIYSHIKQFKINFLSMWNSFTRRYVLLQSNDWKFPIVGLLNKQLLR